MDGNLHDTVPVVYAQNNWSFSEGVITNNCDIKNENCEDILFNFVNAKIDLLIGMNGAEMIKPLEIVEGSVNGPYASRHKLGWALN